MRPSLDDSLELARLGTNVFLESLADVSDADLAAPSDLPGWTRAHVAAHVALNAEGLCNLVHWAITGVRTPMYASVEARNADIEKAAARPGVELRPWAGEASARLLAEFDTIPADRWSTTVATLQGEMPAADLPWLRAREAMIHAVDLDPGLAMTDLPEPFLLALVDDVAARRDGGNGIPALVLRSEHSDHAWRLHGEGDGVELTGSVGDIAAYLTGRPSAVTTSGAGPAPELPRWV